MPTPTGHTTAIRSSRVIGTDVYSTNGDKIGEIEDIMLNKMDNQIMFAVVSFGGFLGMGEKYHPMPWSVLDYNPDRNGYVVPFTKEQLEQAPAESLSDLTKNDGTGARNAAFDHYGAERYW